MKKLLGLMAIAPIALGACGGTDSTTTDSTTTDSTKTDSDSVFMFEHLDGHGTHREMEAHIVWSNNAGTYHQFQIGFTSCICRPDNTDNLRNFIYLEYNKNNDTWQNAEFQHYAESDFTVENLTGTAFVDADNDGLDDVSGDNLEQAIQPWVDRIINGKKKSEIAGLVDKDSDDQIIAGATVTAVNLPRMVVALDDHYNNVIR